MELPNDKTPSGNADGAVINTSANGGNGNSNKLPSAGVDLFPEENKTEVKSPPVQKPVVKKLPSAGVNLFPEDNQQTTKLPSAGVDIFSQDNAQINNQQNPMSGFNPQKAAAFDPNTSAGGNKTAPQTTGSFNGTQKWSDIDNARKAAAAEQLRLRNIPAVNAAVKNAVSTITSTNSIIGKTSQVPQLAQINEVSAQINAVNDALAKNKDSEQLIKQKYELVKKLEKLRSQPIIFSEPLKGEVSYDELTNNNTPEYIAATNVGLKSGSTYGDLYDKQKKAVDKNKKARDEYTALTSKADETLKQYDALVGNKRDEDGTIHTYEGWKGAPGAFVNAVANASENFGLSLKYLGNLAGAVSDEELSKEMDERYTNSILEAKKTKGIVSSGAEMAGGLAPIVVAGALAPEGLAAQMVAGGTSMGAISSGEELFQTYSRLRDEGKSAQEALSQAKKDAAITGTMQTALGAIIPLNEGLLEKALFTPEQMAILGKFKTPGVSGADKAIEDATRARIKDLMLSNETLGKFKHFGAGGVLTSAQFGAGQIAQNWLQGKDPLKDIDNVLLSGALLHTMGAGVDAMFKLPQFWNDIVAKRAPDFYDATLKKISDGSLPVEEGKKLLKVAEDVSGYQKNYNDIMAELKKDNPTDRESSLNLLGKIADMADGATTTEVKERYEKLANDITHHIEKGTEDIPKSIQENDLKYKVLDNIFSDFKARNSFRAPELFLPEIEKLDVPQKTKDELIAKYETAKEQYYKERERYSIKGSVSETPESLEIPKDDGSAIKFTKLENGTYGVEGITDHKTDVVHIKESMSDMSSENIAHLEKIVSSTPTIPADVKSEVSKEAVSQMVDRFTDIKAPDQVGFEDYVGQIEKLNEIATRSPLSKNQTEDISHAIASAIRESITQDPSDENIAENKRLLGSLYENPNVITEKDANSIYKSLSGIRKGNKVTPLDAEESGAFDNSADINPERQAELDKKSAELQKKINTVKFFRSKSWEKAVVNHPAIKRINNALDRLVENERISENGKNLLTSSIMTSDWLPKLIDVNSVRINWSDEEAKTASTYNPRTKTVTIQVDPKVTESQLIREIHEEIMHNAHHNLLLAISPDNAKFDLTEEDIDKITGLNRDAVNRIIGSYYKDSRFRLDDFNRLKNQRFDQRSPEENDKYNSVLDYLSFIRKKFNKDSEGDIFTTEFKDPVSNKNWTTNKIIENYSRYQAFKDAGYSQEQSAYYSMHTGEFFARTMSDKLIQEQLEYAESSKVGKLIDHVTDFFSNSIKLPSLVRAIKGEALDISDVNKMIGDLSAKEIQKINEVTTSKDFYNDSDKATYKKVELKLIEGMAGNMSKGEKNILDYANRLVADGDYLGIENMVLHLNEVLAPDMGDKATNLFLDTLLKNITFSFDRPALDTKTISDFLRARTDGSFSGNMIEYLNSHSYDALGAMRSQSGGFYSSLERFFDENKQDIFTPDQILGATKNLPQTEIDWIGLKDFVAGKQKITKQEILDYINENAIKIVHLSSTPNSYPIKYGYENGFYTVHYSDGQKVSLSNDEVNSVGDPFEIKDTDTVELLRFADKKRNNSKYQEYTINGNQDNYREINLTLPKNPGSYESSHFDGIANPVAHLRLTDRTTIDGRRILFVEEAQSDWAREGRKSGYSEKGALDKKKEIAQKEKKKDKLYEEFDEISKRLEYDDKGEYKNPNSVDVVRVSEIKKEINSLMDEIDVISSDLRNNRAVADMPFKGDKWIELVTKKALQLGAQGGYDGVAFINGDQTANRYSLDKQVNSIQYSKYGNNYEVGVDFKDRNQGSSENYSLSDIEKTFGKDIAKRISEGGDNGRIEGDNLKIKAEWARNLYDKQIPKLADKYAKLYGGKSTRFDIESGEEGEPHNQYGIEITPEMKNKTQQVSLFGNDVYDSSNEELGALRSTASDIDYKTGDVTLKDGTKAKISIDDIDVPDHSEPGKLVSMIGKDGRILGSAEFHKNPETGKYFSFDTSTNKDFRRQGVSSSIYDYFAQNGYDVEASLAQTPAGKKLWKFFNKEEGSHPDEILGAKRVAPFVPTNFVQMMSNSKATTVTTGDMFDELTNLQNNIHQFGTKREASIYANGMIAAWKAQYLKNMLPADFDAKKSEILKLTKLPIRLNISDYAKDINFVDKFVNDSDYRAAYSDAQSALDTSKGSLEKLKKNDIELYQKMRLLTRVSLNSFETAGELRDFSDFILNKSKSMSIDKFSEEADKLYNKYIDEKDEPIERSTSNQVTPAQEQADADTRAIIDIVKNNVMPKKLYSDPKIYELLNVDHEQLNGKALTDYLRHLQDVSRNEKLTKGSNDFIDTYKATNDSNFVRENLVQSFFDEANKKFSNPDGTVRKVAIPFIDYIKGLAPVSLAVKDNYGNISKYNLLDILNFFDGMKRDYSGNVSRIVAKPLEKAYADHLRATHEALNPIFKAAKELTKRDMETIGIHSLLSQVYPVHPISEKLAVELNKEFNTDEFKTGHILKNDSTGVEKEAHDYIQNKIKQGIADSIALSHGEDHVSGDEENPHTISGADNLKIVAEKRGTNVVELRDLRHRILEDNGVSSIKELTDKIISGDIKLTPEQQKFKDLLDDTYTGVKDGRYTNGLGLERAALTQSGVNFEPIEGYTPIIRYNKEEAKPLDLENDNFNESFFGYSQDLNLNESFLEQRKPSLLALNTNALEIAQKRIDQQLFYLLNSDHKNYLNKLFKTDLFKGEDGMSVSTEATNAIKEILKVYYNRGVTEGAISSMNNPVASAVKTGLSNIKSFMVGEWVKAPAQFSTVVSSMASMSGNPLERIICLAKGHEYFNEAFSADSKMNKFLMEQAPEVFYRGLANYQIPMAKDGNIVKNTASGLKEGKYALDTKYGDTAISNLIHAIAVEKDFNKATMLMPLAFTEGMAARVAFFANYENYMRRNGLQSDWDNPNHDAIAAGIQAVRKTQHTTYELAQPMITKGIAPGYTNIIGNSALADVMLSSLYSFRTFNINQAKVCNLEVNNLRKAILTGNHEEVSNSVQNLAYLQTSKFLFIAAKTAARVFTVNMAAAALYSKSWDEFQGRVKAPIGNSMEIGSLMYKAAMDNFATSDIAKEVVNKIAEGIYNGHEGNDSTPDEMKQLFYAPKDQSVAGFGVDVLNKIIESFKVAMDDGGDKTPTQRQAEFLQPAMMFMNLIHPTPFTPEVGDFANQIVKQEKLTAYPTYKSTEITNKPESGTEIKTH